MGTIGRRPRIALVVPAFDQTGGVPTVASFVCQAIKMDGRFDVGILSLAMSANDPNSVRLLSPRTWRSGPTISPAVCHEMDYEHVGAVWSELEVCRYRRRPVLTDRVRDFDLIQVIAGVPAWALPVAVGGRPLCLQVATLTEVERKSALARARGLRRLWSPMMTRMTARLDQEALQVADAVFVENQWMHGYLQGSGIRGRVLFAPPGVDTNLFRPSTYCPHGYILSVGRFSDPRKNVRLLFRAYAALSGRQAHLPDLVLAGTPPIADDWAYAGQLGITARVRVRAHVPREELRDLYRGASLFVLSSNEEGLGMVILEAMASGLPVVSTDCGGPATTVIEGETGLLTPVGDAEAMADGIQRLLDDPQCRYRMAQTARRSAEQCFSLSAAGKVFLDTYEELLLRTRRRVTQESLCS